MFFLVGCLTTRDVVRHRLPDEGKKTMRLGRLKWIYLVAVLAIVAAAWVVPTAIWYFDSERNARRVIESGAEQLETGLSIATTHRADALAALAAQRLRDAVSNNDIESAGALAQALLGEYHAAQLTLLDRNGIVLGRWGDQPEGELIEGEYAIVSATAATLDDIIGHVRIGIDGAALAAPVSGFRDRAGQLSDETRTRALLLLSAAALGALILIALIGWNFARRLSNAVQKLTHGVKKLADSEYDESMPLDDSEELIELSGVIDDLRDTLRKTSVSRNYLDRVLSSINDTILVTSPDGIIKSVNHAACVMLGYEEDELHGKRVADLVDEDIRDKFPINAATTDVSESVFCTRDGRRIPVSVSCSTITDDDPQFQGSIYVARNITERKRAERRIRYLARYDSLTKIPNRIQFQHLLQRKIAGAKRNHRYLGILYVDLDRFKVINDTFGHMAGDLCLETIAQRLVKQLPDKTVVGRLAGDEFAVILENLPSNHEIRRFLSERAREILDCVAGAFYVEESEVFLTGSIGIATYPADAENVIDLIRNADAAMYHAKQHGGNTYEFYTPEMNDAAVERLTLKSKLKRALERDELEIRYQPKIDLRDGKIIGAEALLRWRLIGHGDIPPSTFIPLAEESNLIREIGDWVIRKVCADYGEWQSRVSTPGRIAVNVSLKQLQHPNFMYRIKAIFNEFKISPTCLELEITETTLMHDAKRTLRVLDELYGMGLHLSIDDFGTGYSSLSVLQQFPISTLKIDQSFVRDTAIDSDDATIVKTIIDMGRSMDMEVVAEGVETEEQLSFLRQQDCNYAQGHLFGESLTAKEFLEVLLDQSEGTNRHRALFA